MSVLTGSGALGSLSLGSAALGAGINSLPVISAGATQMVPGFTQTATAAAVAAQDMALFGYAEQLIAQVEAAEDPESVAIQSGWPTTYQDTINPPITP